MDAPDKPTLQPPVTPRAQVPGSAARAHAQKNCLTVIESLTALLARAPLGERESALVAVLHGASSRLHELVLEDITSTFPRVLAARELDLSEVIRCVCGRLAPVALERGVQLTMQLTPAMILGHRTSLEEALTNIVLNAIQASFPSGSILLLVEHDTGHARCSVLDEGEGFSDGDSERPSKPGGSGLGLSITREIAEQHNGWLNVAPRDGGGTRVELWLPLATSR